MMVFTIILLKIDEEEERMRKNEHKAGWSKLGQAQIWPDRRVVLMTRFLNKYTASV